MNTTENIKITSLLFEDESYVCYGVLTTLSNNKTLLNLKEETSHLFLFSTDDEETNLFEFKKGSLFLDIFIKNELLKRNIVVLCVPKESNMEQIKNHIVNLKKAISSSGELIGLPICDPRFLIKLLPSCIAEDIDIIFAPIHKFIMWAQDNNNLVTFEKSRDKVKSKLVEL